ncbi:MAG: Ppx/GppA family phosphatase [Paracoccus sp. (in: a-proteobacteria)]|uniref:Ppx/GppA family phosphatase n=1 Tax=unclassified Paracoccus (in: a-proteobacteria) TaxID=2688777 RepID=UPI000C5B422D|nr:MULTISPECIES: Ppx/GppA family phosphatase [unclassified Paracoccus (in: a-proteobacteria)]MAN55393.1 exopolyphosphatase [Paracoccus sp. (in: a-proteobacteria)]MDB2552546.1 Ppx/GppA family phosphatase [Paracoccus sp. (in: a-proteobacteria)]|tara:strand:- start:92 stop:1627 length:1536 start_codon:yes stop_codon:yes gene_type:complete
MNGVRTNTGRQIEPFGKMFDTLPKRALKRVGVVDVGSNSIRLVVFDGAARSPAYFYNEKVMAGLGAEMASTGRLNPAGVERGFAALSRFAALAKGMDIEPLTCVATAAVREAEDGPDFQARIERETGIRMWVIDGEEEARLSAQGVLLGWPGANGLVCDIGGNSMELAELKDGKVGRRATSQLGPFRLQQIKGGKDGLKAHIRSIMADLAQRMGTDHQRIYLVGGSWRAIARLDMERSDYPMTVLHEYRMTPQAVADTLDWIGANDLNELRGRVGISSSRMELVPLASQVLSELVETFGPADLAISSYGIREGLLYEHMSDTLRKRDPLIEAARFTERQMARMPGFGKKLYQFLLPIFGRVPADRERLIRAACLLHDTTWRAHPDYRAEACFDNVTRANMAALSHPERVFLGLALLHRYKNSRSKSPMLPLFALLSEAEIRDAEILGKAMRFGAMFSIDDPSDAGSLKLAARKSVLELTLTRTGRQLMGEVAHSRFKSLCNAMAVEPLVKD